VIRTQQLVIIVSILIGAAAAVHPCAAQGHDSPPAGLEIGIDEKLGGFVPLDLGFLDAGGDSVYLRDVIDKPTVLTLVYYHCPTICKPLLGSVVEVMDKTNLEPGYDYAVLTISFDETDTPESADVIRANFTTALERELVLGAWKFLTADSVTIARLTDSVGFRFQRREKDFAHGTSLIFLSPDGKIVRYLYGLRYMPFDLRMAVSEAGKGSVAPSIARVLQYCFSYDPEGRRYALNLNRVLGTVILLFAVGWAIYISAAGRRKRKVRTQT
jgi:protein SCO1/2